MQPWFTKKNVLWQLRKNALNYPQKTFLCCMALFKECLWQNSVLSVFLWNFGCWIRIRSRKRPKMHSGTKKWHFFKKYPISTRYILFIKFAALFYSRPIFSEHNKPKIIQIGPRIARQLFLSKRSTFSPLCGISPATKSYFYEEIRKPTLRGKYPRNRKSFDAKAVEKLSRQLDIGQDVNT